MSRDMAIFVIAVASGVVVWALTRGKPVVLARGMMPPEGLAALSGPDFLMGQIPDIPSSAIGDFLGAPIPRRLTTGL